MEGEVRGMVGGVTDWMEGGTKATKRLLSSATDDNEMKKL